MPDERKHPVDEIRDHLNSICDSTRATQSPTRLEREHALTAELAIDALDNSPNIYALTRRVEALERELAALKMLFIQS